MSVSTNQHLTVFVSRLAVAQGTSAAGTIGETLDVALDTGNASQGQITYQSTNGLCYDKEVLAKAGAIDATPANDTGDGNYWIVYRALDGSVYRRLIQDALYDEVSKPYTAQVQKTATITVTGSTVGEEYVLRVALPNYAEMISQQDEKYFYGSHVVQQGDTTTNIATGLVESLQKAMAAVPTPVIDVSNSGAVITVVGLKQPYVRAKFQGKLVDFHLSFSAPASELKGETVTVLPVNGYGVDNQVLVQEEFFAGYNEDYASRDAHFPGNGNPTFAAEVGGTYNSSNWVLAKARGGANFLTQRQEIICYFKQ